jgi:hypothetical protein
MSLQSCRVCGCTDSDCSHCIERTGHPCSWVDIDLCSACTNMVRVHIVTEFIDRAGQEQKGSFRSWLDITLPEEQVLQDLKYICAQTLDANGFAGSSIQTMEYTTV